MKKKSLSTVLIIIILFIIFGFVLFFTKPNSKDSLDNIGYNEMEIKEINKLTKSEIDIIMKYDYNNNLIYMIKSENYNPNKLDLYLKYTKEYKDIEYLKIFELLNSKNFEEKNADKYIELLKEYNSPLGIINYINNYSDKNIKIDETTLSFMQEKYFIFDYLDRYLKYYKKNSNLDFSEIITRINSNLDYTFYTDSNKADLSKDMYTLVNKYNYLDKNYVPEDIVSAESGYTSYNGKLNKTAYENFVIMADAAKKNNLCLKITTGYRDYNFQSTLYNNYVKLDGVKNADTYSARPGYSEHQLGYSADLTNGNNASFDEFEYTDEFKWLEENAYKYGFILRYPKDKEYITGYQYESWHYRYVGVEIATYIHENNITYEEYYAYFLR